MRYVTPLGQTLVENTPNGGQIEYEFFPVTIDVLGPLLFTLFEENWRSVQVGHVVEGSVLELEFNAPPKINVIYDGYLTVVTDSWHLHLCVEEHRGGPHDRTSKELQQHRLVSKGAFYRRFNQQGQPRSWGIQFWNGKAEKMMTLFLPNPFVAEDESLLPEHQPNLAKLSLYESLRRIYVLGLDPIPFPANPLKKPYISVCRSGRCLPSREWQPIYQALKEEVEKQGLDVRVGDSGCLEVCKMGPVVFYSADRTWYCRVTPEVARQIVRDHLVNGQKVERYLYASHGEI
ncbi:MAG: (2Fe-2S) ferredoxin domain-containing protein [Pseudanabaenaceae cyanobacterium SKYGB_i_bin29]|nr:(2Fe-2S) ferredoxin domain-containing protein [Pseudanabaenaceae cyanobacterium SKYG29]MDW8421364.1 (2Fe-2S) ferredoxin domain-containing protein [Pseudanabaenaceae cyanobacterium SKYGB_i_bin29]